MRIRRKLYDAVVGLAFLGMILGSFLWNYTPIFAQEETGDLTAENSTEAPHYNISNGIVQVVLVYQDEEGYCYILQSGSGIVVDSSTIITSQSLLHLTEEKKVEIGAYLSETLEKEINFVQGEGGSNVASYQIAIVEEADIYNFATELFSSADWDVALLSLSTPVSKEKAVLGDSDIVKEGDAVSALGFPTTDYTNPRSFQLGDVVITNGSCVNRQGGDIGFDAGIELGNTGGALVDEYGRVIGITSYADTPDGSHSALSINQVKGYLVKYSVAYMEDLIDYNAVEAEATTEVASNEYQTDKDELYRTIKEAQLIFDDGNEDEIYTKESFRNLELNLDYAKTTYDNPEAEQRQIDADNRNLRNAIDDLEKVEKDNTTVIILIVVISVLVVAIIVVMIIFLVSHAKKKKEEEAEKQRLKSIDQVNASKESAVTAAPSQNLTSSYPSSQLYAQFDAKKSFTEVRTVPMSFDEGMQQADMMGTSILNASVPQQSAFGYVYRSADGESVAILVDEFIIGKGVQDVSYRIDDNPNISRKHVKITRNYNDYYIEDLNSTNGTYVNGVQLVPGQKQLLQQNDVIMMGNEELIFMISA